MGYDSPLAAFPSFLLCNFFFFFASILIISAPCSASKGVMPLCLSNQSSALLQFKRGIVLWPGMLSSWKKGTDCCDWEGVTCDSLTGSVTTLQIPNVSVHFFYNLDYNSYSRLDPSLFELSHLRVLDLGDNGFNGTIPKRLVELTHLTHLDLSKCYFSGAVPTEISQLTRLVYLNLSSNYDFTRNYGLHLENNSFTNLVGGLSRLQHLALDDVNISMSGKSMSTVVSSSMPCLHTLSLRLCNVFGTMDESILQLHSLSYIDLSGNHIQSIPEFFQNFTSLRVLKLEYCGLVGFFPSAIFLLPKLETLDVSSNDELFLPSKGIPSSSNIQYLDLSYTKRLHGDIMVLSNLTRLSHLNLHGCAINGSIPSSWASNKTVYFDLSSNNLKGSIPTEISQLTRLVYLDLSSNNLNGSIPESFCLSSNLRTLHLSGNFLRGSIPSCLFSNSNLEVIDLSQNRLSLDISSSVFNLASIRTIDLGNNLLNGSIHSSIFHLPTLEELRLNDNQLTGEISTTTVNLPSLWWLDLSNNMLTGSITSSLLNLPDLVRLYLSNNKFNGSLPDFFNGYSSLGVLLLGNNCFSGVIPSSIRTLSELRYADLSSNCFNGTTDLSLFFGLHNLSYLDLSNTKELTVLESSYSSQSYHRSTGLERLQTLNLSSCNIKSFPNFLCKLENLAVLDLSNNGITGKVSSCLWGIPTLRVVFLDHNKIEGFEEAVNSSEIEYLYAHDNAITGEIPTFICSFTRLMVLEISNNTLTGTITVCLGSLHSLSVLNLAKNQLHGQIPALSSVEFISFSENLLSGKIDPDALRNCTNSLQVLDLGNNQLNDTFPSWLSSFDNLTVLVLRSNHLFGPITLSPSRQAYFSSLHILDISKNHFSGSLPHKLFKSLKAMMANNESEGEPRISGDESEGEPFLEFYFPLAIYIKNYSTSFLHETYMVTLTQTFKGKNYWIQKIMKTLIIIDLSNNMFTDHIPEEIGMLKGLRLLNISNNNLSGTIPSSLGYLKQMEALDLSCNHLTGVIPVELSALTFLAILNLSYNDLWGQIPEGNQFSTFDESSFEGNPGLCGPQLPQRPCSRGRDDPGVHQQTSVDWEKDWEYGALGIGFAVGLLFVTLPILLSERLSNWYWNLIDRVAQFLMQLLFYKSAMRLHYAG